MDAQLKAIAQGSKSTGVCHEGPGSETRKGMSAATQKVTSGETEVMMSHDIVPVRVRLFSMRRERLIQTW